MAPTPESKSPAVFSIESIRAMSPMGQEIASMLEEAGYIQVGDEQGRLEIKSAESQKVGAIPR